MGIEYIGLDNGKLGEVREIEPSLLQAKRIKIVERIAECNRQLDSLDAQIAKLKP